ncbi:MAG: hypothetical protein RL070_138 [Bacteroidota bacterium]|jgi:hypothetical protein
MNNYVVQLKSNIEPVRNTLLAHPVYSQIQDLQGLKRFSETHVFAVWDFMSLLKSLQIGLTSVTLPWVPVGNADTRYLINEIVLGEESDVDEAGNRISHFELYLKAMQQMGASTNVIETIIDQINTGIKVQDAIEGAQLPKQVKDFLKFTFDISFNAPLHVKAAVFTFGREDLIPSMFMKILDKIYVDAPDKVSIFKYYIERHIEIDGDHHSHLALDMVSRLCGSDASKWEEATVASVKALALRIGLWDAIFEQ